MTTVDKEIEKLENEIEETKEVLGIIGGKDLLIQLYSNLAELRKQQTTLLGQTGKEFILERWGH
jgi:hypothetical protein